MTNNALAQGMVVYRTQIEQPGPGGRVDHLNPQTMDHVMDTGDDDDHRGRGRGKD